MMKTLTSKATTLISGARLLIMQAQLAGNLILDGHTPSPGEDDIAAQCRLHASRIADVLQHCHPDEIAPLLECYDALYRLGHNRMPDAAFGKRLQRKVISTHEAGDTAIPESHIFAVASSLSRSEEGDFGAKMKELHKALKDKWIMSLRKFNRFPDATAYETYQRLALLMQEPAGDDTVADRCRWFDANRIDDFSTAGTLILQRYRRYVMTLFPDVLDYESRLALDTALLEELLRRPDLDPRTRRAHTLSLTLNSQL